MLNKIKLYPGLSIFLLLLTGFSCHASEFTGETGLINGTAPEVYNANNDAGKIDISKDSPNGADQVLDIGDKINLSWDIRDSEGDSDATDPTIVWYCTDPQNSKHNLQSGGHQYVLTAADAGCTVGVSLTPSTLTGLPRANEALVIDDISKSSDTDNIPDGPVNTHLISFKDYIVNPGQDTALTVAPDKLLHTAWHGAQIQLDAVDTASTSSVSFSSSDDSVATVTSSGLVTFLAKGSVTFTANNGYTSATITFNPTMYFVISDTSKNWPDMNDWCDSQPGYVMPTASQLSNSKARTVPADSLWQEWGEAPGATSPVWWSSTRGGEADAHQYIYLSSGSISDNHDTVEEGGVCVSTN